MVVRVSLDIADIVTIVLRVQHKRDGDLNEALCHSDPRVVSDPTLPKSV